MNDNEIECYICRRTPDPKDYLDLPNRVAATLCEYDYPRQDKYRYVCHNCWPIVDHIYCAITQLS